MAFKTPMNPTKKIAIALGSNLGDSLGIIQEAAHILMTDVLQDAELSCIIETEPWGETSQPNFLNAVIVGRTDWKAPAIVNYLKNLERELGRKTRKKNGPREIDLDLLCIENKVFEGDGVKVPHPGIASRDFVLLPLSQVWPEWVHPVLKKTVDEMKSELKK